MTPEQSRPGAYGLALLGELPSGIDRYLQPATEDAPLVTIDLAARVDVAGSDLDEATATAPLLTGGSVRLDRTARRATIRVDGRPGAAELAHPILSPVGSVFAHWDGREPYHAGAFARSGAAWVVLGTKGAGKSTLLAELWGRELIVVADDLAVIDGTAVLAGPRCVDLKRSSAERSETPLEGVRGGSRFRLRLAPCPGRTPLAGFVALRWGPRPSVREATLRERLELLGAHRAVQRDPVRPAGFLDLQGHRLVIAERPRAWSGLRGFTDAVLAATD